MRHPVRLPSEVKLALIIIGVIVTYALYRVGGPALALASNAISAIAGWMGRGAYEALASRAPAPAQPGAAAAPPAPPAE